MCKLPVQLRAIKQGQGPRIVQDFHELNNHSHIDKHSMKDITECISNIGHANSTIFSTLNLTSSFWQMQLDEQSQPSTDFTIPGRGQFNQEVSHLGFTLTPEGIKQGKNKLKAIKDTKPPTCVKRFTNLLGCPTYSRLTLKILQFAAPLFKLT